MIFPLGAHDFPYLFHDQVVQLLNLPFTWYPQSHDALGVFTLSTLWTWVYGLLFGLGANLGLDFSLLTLILGIIPTFIIGWFAIGHLLQGYQLSTPAKLVGQLLYVANTYVLLLIDGGQLSIALAYSLLPLVIHFIPHRPKFILTLLLISFLDIRFVYLALILTGIYLLFDLKKVLYCTTSCLLAGLVIIGCHSYWLLPSLLVKPPALPETYTRPAQVESLSFAKISHALFLYQPHWPKNIFGRISAPVPAFVFLSLLVFAAVVIYRRDRDIAFWSILALTGLLLVKGSNPPLPGLYPWLFTHLPGFSLFRDPLKFFPFLTLSYSVLTAFTVNWLNTKFRFSFVVISGYLVFLILPLLLGQATGLFSFSRSAGDYQDLAAYLSRDKSPGNLLWVPSKPPLGFSSPVHLSIDALTLLDRRPFATGVVGSYELLNFLRDATYSGQLLDISGIKYLGISALDPRRDSQKPADVLYHSQFIDQLSTRPWVKSRRDFGSVTLLETKSTQPLFFSPGSTVFVVGSDDLYRTQGSLADHAYVFTESQPDLLRRIKTFPNAQLLVNHKSQTDLAAGLISMDRFLFPARNLDFSPDASGWWKRETSDFISWRDFLQQKYGLDNQDLDYGGGLAVSEGSHSLSIRPGSCIPDCILLARVMVSSVGGKITFNQGQSQLGEINTLRSHPDMVNIDQIGSPVAPDKVFTYSSTGFYWFELGKIDSAKSLTINTSGNLNVVNSLAIVPASDWQSYRQQAQDYVSRYPLVDPGSAARITFVKHNPTSYTITVAGLTGPATLAFSQNYDSLWSLDGQSPVPLYGFINGFSLPGSGTYNLNFLPQKYVLPGLLISVSTIFVFFFVWFIWVKSRRGLK